MGSEVSDVDIGSEFQAPTGLLRLPPPSPAAQAGDMTAVLPKWQGAGAKARHQVGAASASILAILPMWLTQCQTEDEEELDGH